jgi:hypothetical protein
MQAAYAERRPLSHKHLSLEVKASHADVGQVEAEVLAVPRFVNCGGSPNPVELCTMETSTIPTSTSGHGTGDRRH